MSLLSGLPEGLLPASFRGVPFAVVANSTGGGRRQVVHQYPGRDDPWTEDLGREARTFSFKGFLVANDRIYMGGPVALQRLLLYAALEAAGPGPLTHPTLGLLNVCVRRFSLGEDLAGGSYSDVEIEFVEAGKQLFPSILAASGVLGGAATVLKIAVAADAVRAIVAATAAGGQRSDVAVTSQAYSGQVVALGNDATSAVGLAAQMDGPFGRYQKGGNSGYAGTILSADASATVAALTIQAAAARAAISSAATSVEEAISGLTVTTVEADVADAVRTLIEMLASACADPADALRLLRGVIAFTPEGPEAVSALGRATCDLYQRTAVACLAGTAADYQPSSYDDAAAKLTTITDAIDGAALAAGDEGADDSYQALEALRAAVVQDLTSRGAALAPIRTFTFARPRPALALAQMLYRDADRADELVGQVDPVSPLFMPTSFGALAA